MNSLMASHSLAESLHHWKQYLWSPYFHGRKELIVSDKNQMEGLKKKYIHFLNINGFLVGQDGKDT